MASTLTAIANRVVRTDASIACVTTLPLNTSTANVALASLITGGVIPTAMAVVPIIASLQGITNPIDAARRN